MMHTDGLRHTRDSRAATVLQSRERMRSARSAVGRKRQDSKEGAAATRLQSRSRKRSAERRVDAIHVAREQKSAAVTLQCARRTTVAIAEANVRRRETAKRAREYAEKQRVAATLLQSRQRRKTSTRIAQGKRVEREEREAAIAIQTRLRAGRVRGWIRAVLGLVGQHRASATIQRGVRMHLARGRVRVQAAKVSRGAKRRRRLDKTEAARIERLQKQKLDEKRRRQHHASRRAVEEDDERRAAERARVAAGLRGEGASVVAAPGDTPQSTGRTSQFEATPRTFLAAKGPRPFVEGQVNLALRVAQSHTERRNTARHGLRHRALQAQTREELRHVGRRAEAFAWLHAVANRAGAGSDLRRAGVRARGPMQSK